MDPNWSNKSFLASKRRFVHNYYYANINGKEPHKVMSNTIRFLFAYTENVPEFFRRLSRVFRDHSDRLNRSGIQTFQNEAPSKNDSGLD
ncbi:PF14082 domain protein [Leptospira santarosai]|uniref:PF14082 domain protein n=1 Tax=Leptospira santarosai TaxID=28183 RepID=A0A2P1QRC6_9LEPT|nr:PF14082 domain protein [Leptospira santarosai]